MKMLKTFCLSTLDGNMEHIWMFPNMEEPQNGWFKMDDLGVPLFSETTILNT